MTIVRQIHSKTKMPSLTVEQLDRLNALSQRAVDLSDEPEDLEWSNAERGKFTSKKISIDDELYTWLQKDGKNPQKRVNEILHWVRAGEMVVTG